MFSKASCGVIESADIAEYQQIIPPWDVVLHQMSAGRFHARMEYVHVNGILIYREHWTRRVLVNGATPAGYYVIGGPIAETTQVNWCGIPLSSQLIATAQPSTEVDFLIPGTGPHIVMMMPKALLSAHDQKSVERAGVQGRHLSCKSESRSTFYRILNYIIDQYLAQGQLLEDTQICQMLQLQLIDALKELVSTRSTKRSLTATCRTKVFLNAIEACNARAGNISVQELASAANTSQRNLELAFKETLQTSPHKYLCWHRLNSLHHQLLNAEPEPGTITRLGNNLGFTELGRLSRDYRMLFGELPSATLRKNEQKHPRQFKDLICEPLNN